MESGETEVDPRLDPAAELEQISEILRLYAKALSGREIHLVPIGGAGQRGAGWGAPVDDGSLVRLSVPPRIGYFDTERENFEWYKVILTHHAGHLEFGSGDLSLERPSKLFVDWRPNLAEHAEAPSAGDGLAGLLRLFPDPALGAALFEIVEDARIDAHVLARYAGVRSIYQHVAAEALSRRGPLMGVPLRQAFVEALIVFSLGVDPLPAAPRVLEEDLGQALSLLGQVRQPEASVEDAAEAALRIYQIAARLPNIVPEDDECDHDHDHEHKRPTDDDTLPDRLETTSDKEDMPFQMPERVEFRPPLDLPPPDDAAQPAQPPDDGEHDAPEPDGPLTRDKHFSYIYPEWDFRAGAYRERWCRAYEQVLEEGTSDFYVRALTDYRVLVDEVRERFDHLFPELFRKVPRRFDGEDFDLDSLVQLVVDLHAGHTPSEKIYWRRERTQRDVAVAVLLDMSATTSEYIVLKAAESNRPAVTSAQEYSSYLARLATGLDSWGKPIRKQTVAIEKEAAIVLMQALEAIGDSYAFYAFSGSGRGNVQFNIVKNFQERLSQRIARRIDQIAPSHATRMGTAIRHTIHKFERVDAQTRLLILVSDGRPYDRDYGRDEHDLEYAMRDTRQALDEAVRHNIRPFCLTVDKYGADYLEEMCQGLPYEVVDRVEDLPLKLLAAYPKLTA